MRAVLGMWLGVACLAAGGAAAQDGVTIERATVPWPELVRLLAGRGAKPARARPGAPLAYALTRYDVEGEVSGDQAHLRLVVELEVLHEGWIVAPLLPARFAVASVRAQGGDEERRMVANDGKDLVLVVEGPGRFRLDIEAEGGLEPSARGLSLSLAPPGLTAGRARLRLPPRAVLENRARWRLSSGPGGHYGETTLGPRGLNLGLILEPGEAPPAPAQGGIEDLEAITVVTLGGRGVTRLLMTASPDARHLLVLDLPRRATLWRAYVGDRPLPLESLGAAPSVSIPLARTSRVEVAYTFEAPSLGIRGHYRLELPRLPFTVRNASWQTWMPAGMSYSGTQASLEASPSCNSLSAVPRTRITAVGVCFAFARPVLEPQAAYVEGEYKQAL